MKKYRIVHVEDRFHPDMGYQLNFTAKFHDSQFEMHIICSNSLKLFNHKGLTEEVIKQKDTAFEKENNITIHRLPVRYEKKQGYNMLIKGLLKKIYELSPDVLFIHALETYTAFQLLRNKQLYKDFLVCTDTHTLDNQFKNSIVEKVYFKALKKLSISNLKKHKSPVFFTATENKRILLEKYGLNKNQIFPYIIGTDSNVFYPDNLIGTALKNELNIADNCIVVFYAGKFNAPKSPHLIIEAINTIKVKDEEICLLFVGGKSEPYFTEIFNTTKDKTNHEVIVKDAVKSHQLNQYYNMADIAVFPKENTLSALDAQLCKLPLVMVSDLTNNERLIKGGLTYKQNDINDLGDKIKQLIEDKQLRDQLGNNGHDYIKSNYSYKAIIRDMEHVIKEQLKLR